MLSPMLPMITESLLNLAILFSHEVLSLVLETLAMVLAVRIASLFNLHELFISPQFNAKSACIQVDKNFTATCESKVCPLTIALFLKHNSG
jgi:hypothetical protein